MYQYDIGTPISLENPNQYLMHITKPSGKKYPLILSNVHPIRYSALNEFADMLSAAIIESFNIKQEQSTDLNIKEGILIKILTSPNNIKIYTPKNITNVDEMLLPLIFAEALIRWLKYYKDEYVIADITFTTKKELENLNKNILYVSYDELNIIDYYKDMSASY